MMPANRFSPRISHSPVFSIPSRDFSAIARNSRNRKLRECVDTAPPVHEAPPSLVSPFHPFRFTPAPLFLVGWLGKRDATHLLPNYFAHGSVKNFPRCHYCSVARENLVICSFHCSFSLSLSPFLSLPGGRSAENALPLSFREVATRR